MDTGKKDKKRLHHLDRCSALFSGSSPPRGPAPGGVAAKHSPLALSERRKSFIHQVFNRISSKFSRDKSKAPAEPECPKSDKSDTGSPRPDIGPLKQARTSENIHESIIQLVHQVLGPDAITLDGQADIKNIVGDMRQDLQTRCTTNGSSRKKITKILKRVDHYFRIVDVAIQHQPQVVRPWPRLRNPSNPIIVIGYSSRMGGSPYNRPGLYHPGPQAFEVLKITAV